MEGNVDLFSSEEKIAYFKQNEGIIIAIAEGMKNDGLLTKEGFDSYVEKAKRSSQEKINLILNIEKPPVK